MWRRNAFAGKKCLCFFVSSFHFDAKIMQIRVDEKGVITEAKFKTFGCGSAIASSSLATEWLKVKCKRKQKDKREMVFDSLFFN